MRFFSNYSLLLWLLWVAPFGQIGYQWGRWCWLDTTLRHVDKTVAGADLDAAATKIQAIFRGKVARQLVKTKLHAIAAIGRVKLHGQPEGLPLQTEGEDKDDARESARNAPGIIVPHLPGEGC